MAIKALLFLLSYLLLVTVRVSSFEEESSGITENYHGEAPAPTPEKHHHYFPPKKAPAHAPKPPHVHPPVKPPAHSPKPHAHPPVKAPAHSPKPHSHPPVKPPVHPPVKAPIHPPMPVPPIHPPVKAPIHPPMPPVYPPVKAPIHPPMPPVYPPVKAPISPPWPPAIHGCSRKCVEYCKGKQDQRRRCQRVCSACCYKSKCVPEKSKVCPSWGHVIYHGRFVKCP